MESSVTVLGTLTTVARVLLAVVFLIAGIPKLFVGEDLSRTIRTLGIERSGLVLALRFSVPTAETAVGLWLLVGAFPVAASLAAMAMLTSFTIALVRLRDRDAAGCACFLWDDGNVGIAHVVRNLILITAAAGIGVVALLERQMWEPLWTLSPEYALIVAASVLFVFLLYALIATSVQFARNLAANS